MKLAVADTKGRSSRPALDAAEARAGELKAALRERAAYVAELEGRAAESKQSAESAEAEFELRLLSAQSRAEGLETLLACPAAHRLSHLRQ